MKAIIAGAVLCAVIINNEIFSLFLLSIGMLVVLYKLVFLSHEAWK